MPDTGFAREPGTRAKACSAKSHEASQPDQRQEVWIRIPLRNTPGMEDELVESRGESPDHLDDLVRIHRVETVDTPDGIRCPQSLRRNPERAMQVAKETGEPRHHPFPGAESTEPAATDPHLRGLSDEVGDDPPHDRMEMKVMMGVDEPASDSSPPEELPLREEFIPDPPTRTWEDREQDGRREGRLTPRPSRTGDRP